jgi:5-methylcytosine-specific restriction enzyme A
MSKRVIEKTLVKALDGSLLCQWCFNYLDLGESDFCNKYHEKEFKQRSSYNQLRADTFERDKGVCAKCQYDTEVLARNIEDKKKFADNPEDIATFLVDLGFNPNSALWEADHIQPLALGGNIGLDNVQTLCYKCHRSKTKDQNNARNEDENIFSELFELLLQASNCGEYDPVSSDQLELAHKVFTKIKRLQDFQDKVLKLLAEDVRQWQEIWPLVQNHPVASGNWFSTLKGAINKL